VEQSRDKQQTDFPVAYVEKKRGGQWDKWDSTVTPLFAIVD
jgi:hypothetical protein